MSQTIKEKIKSFDEKLRLDRINNTHNSQNEITDYYYQLLEALVADYQTYREYFPLFLASIENNDAKAYSISIFIQLYEKIFSECNIDKLDLIQFNEKISTETSKKLISQFEKCLATKNIIRISEFDFNVENFTEQEIKECISHVVDILQINSEIIEWSEEQAENHIIQLAVIKSLLKSIGNKEYFYFVVSMFLDRLNTSEYFQAARDVAEEIIIASFIDGVPELGFLNSYHCYSRQTSINAAVLYANMTLYILFLSEKSLQNKLAQKIIWESIKYFRNVKIYPLAIKIYESIPKEVSFSAYERRAIDHTYFSCLLLTKDKTLPTRILYYLHKEREDVLRAGPKEAHPWLLILHNIKRLYPDADFSQTGLGFYLNTFNSMVPKESSGKFINIIDGNSKDLKDYLKVSLIKLNETRSKNDLVHDNDKALTIANRLIEYSFASNDDEAILLAMIIKSDFSLIFQSKETSLFRPFILPSNDLEKFNSLYGNHSEISQILSCSESELIIWLAVSEGKLFQLSLLDGKFIYSDLELFDWNTFHNLRKSN